MDKIDPQSLYSDAISAVITTIIGVLIVIYGLGLTGDSGLFPMLVGILMVIGSVGLLVTSLYRIHCMPVTAATIRPSINWHALRQVVIAASGLTIYALVLVPLGFFTATALLLLLLPLALGYRHTIAVIVNALVVLICLYLIFIVLFERPLPAEFFLR